jgi:hypothetical protein
LPVEPKPDHTGQVSVLIQPFADAVIR